MGDKWAKKRSQVAIERVKPTKIESDSSELKKTSSTTQLVGDRQLAEYAKKARATVRGWWERENNPLPYTVNGKDQKVFLVSIVDQWLASRETNTDEEKAAAKAVQIAQDEEKLRGMELDNDEREFKKNKREETWQHKDQYSLIYRQALFKIKRYVDKFVDDQIKKNPNLTPSQREELQREKIDLFNKIADLSQENR